MTPHTPHTHTPHTHRSSLRSSLQLSLHPAWTRALALQLRPLSPDATISAPAFSLLSLLAEQQLSALAAELHRLAALQRRQQPAPADLALLLRGFQLCPADLEVALQQQQYTRAHHPAAAEALDTETARATATLLAAQHDPQLNATPFQRVEQEQQAALQETNPGTGAPHIPAWLPAFPPGHTYLHTPQYNAPPADAAEIRVRAVAEGKQGADALGALLRRGTGTGTGEAAQPPSPVSPEETDGEARLAQEESLALYTYAHTHARPARWTPYRPAHGSAANASRRFDIEQHAHARIAEARRQVARFEQAQVRLRANPFVQLSRVSHGAGRGEKRAAVRAALRRSLAHLRAERPAAKRRREHAETDARARREQRLGELRAAQEERARERRAGLAASQHLETVLFEAGGAEGEGEGEIDDADLALFGEFEAEATVTAEASAEAVAEAAPQAAADAGAEAEIVLPAAADAGSDAGADAGTATAAGAETIAPAETEAVAAVPAVTPTEILAENPAETTAETPAETPELPSETPEVQSETPAHMPSETPAQTPGEAPASTVPPPESLSNSGSQSPSRSPPGSLPPSAAPSFDLAPREADSAARPHVRIVEPAGSAAGSPEQSPEQTAEARPAE
ncbi:Taf8 protein [Maudiozyma humilis]|uniref:Transcription initiation factor TFIID subunit 8 n=1 Tax=Maudiozyma humilis TaxID=51915 RepID=A0AAV5S6C5_MAUHU|nr:Taf8 protein [Kazachstania humilis]